MAFFKLIYTFFFELFRTVLAAVQSAGGRSAGGEPASGGGASTKKRPLVAVIAVVVIVGSVISLFITQCNSSPRINTAPFVGLGQAMAAQTVEVVGSKGNIVVVAPDLGQTPMPFVDAQLKAFQNEIKQHPEIKVMLERVKFDQPDSMEANMSGAMFSKLVEKYSTVDAIVSFVGAPTLSPTELAHLPARLPKLIANCQISYGLKKLFQEGLLQRAIVPRFEGGAQTSQKPRSPREWFERYFQVVDAEKSKALPE